MTNKSNVEELEPETTISYVKKAIKDYIYGESVYINVEAFKRGINLVFDSWVQQHTYFFNEIEAARQYFNEFLEKQGGLLQKYQVPSRRRDDDGER